MSDQPNDQSNVRAGGAASARPPAPDEFEPSLAREEMEAVILRVVPMMAAAQAPSPRCTAYHPIGVDACPAVGAGEAVQYEAALFMVAAGGAPYGTRVALELLKDLAGRGHLFSFRTAGLLHLAGELGRPDPVLALKWFLRGAEAGSVECLFELGRAYDLGLGTGPDQALAQKFYRMSAERGDPRGQHELGVRLARAAPSPDDAGALAWILRAASAGWRPSQLLAAMFHQQGLGTPRDPVEAARWYEEAAGAGVVEAQARLALMCAQNPEVPGFPAKAVQWASMAANAGSAEAQGLLGKMLALGLGMDPDHRAAIEWLNRAAEGGHGLAILNLVHIHLHGLGDVPADRDMAVRWLMRGLELGYPPAMYLLAMMCRQGDLVERDPSRSEAILAGVDPGSIPAIEELIEAVRNEFLEACPEGWQAFGA